MPIVADESVDFGIVTALRERGFDVSAIAELFPSIPDPQVLRFAVEKNALLLTEDKDFGELVYRLRLPHRGILLIRIQESGGETKYERVVQELLAHADEMANAFSVLSDEKLRIKRPADGK